MTKFCETSLFGGKVVDKDESRVEAYGILDELNCFIGLARTHNSDAEIESVLRRIQNDLFVLGADVAALPEKKSVTVREEQVKWVEETTFWTQQKLDKLDSFLVPGGSRTASYLQVARAVCRRAERRIVTLSRVEEISGNVIKYVNRLSGLLFELARLANKKAGVDENVWRAGNGK